MKHNATIRIKGLKVDGLFSLEELELITDTDQTEEETNIICTTQMSLWTSLIGMWGTLVEQYSKIVPTIVSIVHGKPVVDDDEDETIH